MQNQAGSSQSTWHRIVSRHFWNISSEGDSTPSLGNLFQCMVSCRVKFFLMFMWNFLGISFCPLVLVLLLSTTEQRLVLALSPPCTDLCTLVRSPLSHLFLRLSRSSSLSLAWKRSAPVPSSSLQHLPDLLQELHVSLVLRSPELGTALQTDVLTRAESRGKITSLDLLAMLFLVHPRISLSSWPQGLTAGSWTVCWVPGPPSPSMQSHFPASWPPAVLVPGVILP